jgi:hypothetical protein
MPDCSIEIDRAPQRKRLAFLARRGAREEVPQGLARLKERLEG